MAFTKTVPYDKNGHVVKEYFEPADPRFNYPCYQQTTQWLPNTPKILRLTFMNVSGSAYSSKFAFTDQNGEKWEMTTPDFEQVVPLMVNGNVTGEFIVTKIRNYYHLKLVK